MSESQAFLKKASLFMILDNVSRVLEPILKITCAGFFVGGYWGVFAYLESLVLVLMRLSLLGLDRGVIWLWGQESQEKLYQKSLSRCINTCLLLGLGCVVITIFGLCGALPFFHRDSFQNISLLNYVTMLAAVPFQALAFLCVQALVNKQKLSAGIWIKNIILPLMTYGSPLLFLLCGGAKDHAMPMAYLLSNTVGGLVGVFMLIAHYPGLISQWSIKIWPPLPVLKFSMPLFGAEMGMGLALRSDNLLLMQYANTQGVEVYSIAVMITKSFYAIRESFDNVTLSLMSADGGRFNSEKKNSFNFITWTVASLQLPLWIAIFIWGKFVLALIAPVYASGYWVLVVYSFFVILSTPGMVSNSVLAGMGKVLYVPIFNGIFVVAVFVLNFTLIPTWGALGAGIAMGLSIFISAISSYLFCVYQVRSWLFERNYWLPLIGSILFCIPALFCRTFDYSVWLVSILGSVGLALYGICVWKQWRKVNSS